MFASQFAVSSSVRMLQQHACLRPAAALAIAASASAAQRRVGAGVGAGGGAVGGRRSASARPFASAASSSLNGVACVAEFRVRSARSMDPLRYRATYNAKRSGNDDGGEGGGGGGGAAGGGGSARVPPSSSSSPPSSSSSSAPPSAAGGRRSLVKRDMVTVVDIEGREIGTFPRDSLAAEATRRGQTASVYSESPLVYQFIDAPKFPRNEEITAPTVLVIDSDGTNLGAIAIATARAAARRRRLDLVCVNSSAQPPVCRIVAYGSFLNEVTRKQKAARKQQLSTQRRDKLKEVRFGAFIEDHDLTTKIDQVKRFLAKGHSIKLVIYFKSRTDYSEDLGRLVMQQIIAEIESVSRVDPASIRVNDTLRPTITCTAQPKSQ